MAFYQTPNGGSKELDSHDLSDRLPLSLPLLSGEPREQRGTSTSGVRRAKNLSEPSSISMPAKILSTWQDSRSEILFSLLYSYSFRLADSFPLIPVAGETGGGEGVAGDLRQREEQGAHLHLRLRERKEPDESNCTAAARSVWLSLCTREPSVTPLGKASARKTAVRCFSNGKV